MENCLRRLQRYPGGLNLKLTPYPCLQGESFSTRTKPHGRHQSPSRATFPEGQSSNGHPLPPCQILNGHQRASIPRRTQWSPSLLNQSRKTQPCKTPCLTTQANPLCHRSQKETRFLSIYHRLHHPHCSNGRMHRWLGSTFLISNSRIWMLLESRHGGAKEIPTVGEAEGYQRITRCLLRSQSVSNLPFHLSQAEY